MNLFNKISLIASLIIILFGNIEAQTFQTLGIDVTSNQQYQCVRFGNPKLNTILVINLGNNKQTNMKIAKAKKRLGRKIKKITVRRKNLKKLLKRAKKKLNRETKRIPANQNKLNKFKEQIARLEIKISDQSSFINTLKSLRSSVKNCNKDLPLQGTLEVVTKIAVPEGRTKPVFTALIVHRVSKYPKQGAYCAQISGNSELLPGASGSTDAEAPLISRQSVTVDPCLLKFNDTCLGKENGFFSYFQGFGGTEDPGTCSIPERCSINAATTKLNQLLSNMTIHIVSEGEGC